MRMMVHLGQDGLRVWTVVRSETDPIPLAYGIRGYPDVDDCFAAARQMAETDSMLAVQDGDGRWEWIAYGYDGTPAAKSPRTYENAAACGSALREFRGMLATTRI
jgi:hypothetical protein